MANQILTNMETYVVSANVPTGWAGNTEKNLAVTAALRRYDRDASRVLVEVISGNGTGVYDLSAVLTAAWDEDNGTVTSVEYPFVVTSVEDRRLAPEEWRIIDTGSSSSGQVLHLIEDVPSVDDEIRIGFTAKHEDGDPASTIPDKHIEAVSKLAASEFCLIMAARSAATKESTIGADSWNSGSSVKNWQSMAKEFRKEYQDAVGPAEDGEVGPASVNFTYNRNRLPKHGYGRLIHD